MPVQELEVVRGFEPNFWQPPPVVEPPADILQATKNSLCIDCQHFLTVSRPRWNGGSHNLHQALSRGDDATYLSDEAQVEALALKSTALSCFSIHNSKQVCHNARSRSCDLCMLIHAKILDHPEFGSVWRAWDQESLSGSPVIEYLIRMTVDNYYRMGSSILVYVTDQDSHMIAYTHLQILADVKADEILAGLLPLDDTTHSVMTLVVCGTWLQQCRRDHTRCRSSLLNPSIAPTRLLDLSESESSGIVILHETSQRTEPYNYFTLSHCWGQCDRLRLVQDNLEEFKKGLAVSRLAPTFRDAVEITFKLGHQYLWIDCLCIVQDSKNDEDWLVEASKMASIYGNALCNITASASSDSDGGCFRQRSLADVDFIRFERYPFPVYEGEGTAGPVFIAKNRIDEALNSNNGPLDARGWILQEQILAPRTLHFSRHQVFWECRQWIASESWVAGLPSDFSTSPVHVKSKELLDQSILLQHDDENFSMESPELLNHRWKTIVQLYTNRNLTKAHDKLPALSGIADVFVDLIQDEYFAGLWKRSLLMDLAWWVLPDTRKPNWPKEYRAPSWSWASIDGTVSWQVVVKHEYDMQADIHSAQIIPLQIAAKTGQVKDGSIDISGLIRPCVWRRDTGTLSGMQLTDHASNGWLDTEMKLYPDVQSNNLPSTIIFFQLFRFCSAAKYGSPWGRHRLEGLMLTPVDQTNSKYRRVGRFEAANFGYSKIRSDGWNHFIDDWTLTRLVII